MQLLQRMLVTAYRSHPQLLDWALTHEKSFAGPLTSMVDATASQPAPDALDAVRKLKESVTRLRRQRDTYKGRANHLKDMCVRMQTDLHTMTQIAQQALPHGGGFQSPESVWAEQASGLDAFLLRD